MCLRGELDAVLVGQNGRGVVQREESCLLLVRGV